MFRQLNMAQIQTLVSVSFLSNTPRAPNPHSTEPLFEQLPPFFPHEGENALPAFPPPLLRNPGHHFSTEVGAPVALSSPPPMVAVAVSAVPGASGFACAAAAPASGFPIGDRAMSLSEDLFRGVEAVQ